MIKKLSLVAVFFPLFAYAQESYESKINDFLAHSYSETKEFLKSPYNPLDYLYQGTNIKREPVDKESIGSISAVYYWSTSCHYCKKELKELELILADHPDWINNIIIAMRIDFKRKEGSVKKVGSRYFLMKDDKEFLSTNIPIYLISEKFAEDTGAPGNPHAFFYNSIGEIDLYKGAYYSSKEKMDTPINQLFNKEILSKYID